METCELAPGLRISRIVTGLWQLADMERDGRELDLDATSAAMAPYLEAGLSTFDMADHYGSAEDVTGRFLERHPGAAARWDGLAAFEERAVRPRQRAKCVRGAGCDQWRCRGGESQGADPCRGGESQGGDPDGQ